MKRLFSLIFLLFLSLYSFSQTYNSSVSYRPTYESEVEAINTIIEIEEVKGKITFYSATYEGEITNLRIDSIKFTYWTYEVDEVKTYFCTDMDEGIQVYVLNLIDKKSTIKLIYKWDDISIEEYSFVVKK